jgi:hypothetical protein
LAALGFGCLSRPAYAGGPLGPQGSRIQTSNYGVDLFQGPVFASTRITGIAGAFTAIAEGPGAIDGARDYFAWSVGAGVLH